VLTQEESKDIWEFLVYDAKARKTGDKAAAWREQRRRLLARFDGLQKGRREAPKGEKP
jgi:hypothetical protein